MRGCQTCRVRAICLPVSLSFAASRRFIEDLTGDFLRSVLLASGLGIPPMTLDPKGFASSGVPVSRITSQSRFSAALLPRGS